VKRTGIPRFAAHVREHLHHDRRRAFAVRVPPSLARLELEGQDTRAKRAGRCAIVVRDDAPFPRDGRTTREHHDNTEIRAVRPEDGPPRFDH
jgi:hypothetical protein